MPIQDINNVQFDKPNIGGIMPIDQVQFDDGSWGVGDTFRAAGAVIGGFAAMPVAGLGGLSRLITTGSLDEASKTMEGISSVPSELLTTDRQRQAAEKVGGIISSPFVKAGEGWRLIGEATGIPYAEPVLGTMGEVAGMVSLGGKEAVKGRIKQIKGKLKKVEPLTEPKPGIKPIEEVKFDEPVKLAEQAKVEPLGIQPIESVKFDEVKPTPKLAPKPPEVGVTPEAKQPWEMTRTEVFDPSKVKMVGFQGETPRFSAIGKDVLDPSEVLIPQGKDYLYHYTPLRNIENIKSGGIRTGNQTLEGRSPDLDISGNIYALDKLDPDIFHNAISRDAGPIPEGWGALRFKRKGEWTHDPEFKDEVTSAVLSNKSIPASDIEILTPSGWKPINKADIKLQPAAPSGGKPPLPISPKKLTQEIQSEPDYVYHATNEERLFEIADTGKLRTHKPGEFTDQGSWPDGSTQKRAYFSNKANVVWQFAPEEGSPVVLRTKGIGLKEEIAGDVYSNKPISIDNLEYLGKDDVWHPVSDLKSPSALAVPELKGAGIPTTRQEIVERGASQQARPEVPRSQEITAGIPKEDVTGIKKRIVDAEQQAMGLSDVEREVIKIVPTYEEGRRLIASGERNPRTLAADLVENHRALSPEEAGILIADRVTLKNQHRSIMAEIEKAMDSGDTVLAGEKRTELKLVERDLDTSAQAAQVNRETWSALGKMMQLEAKQDYSLEAMVRKYKVDTGKTEVPPDLRAKFEVLSKQIEEAQTKIAAYEEKLSQQTAVKTVEKLKNTVAREQRDVKRTIKKEVLDAEIRGLYSELNKALGGQLNIGIDPTAIPILGKLAKAYVERGVITAEGIVDAIYTEIKNMGLELSKRDIRDAISGYGTTRVMNQDAIIAQLRELKRQMALISGLEDATGGISPIKRFQADVETSRVRELKKQIKQAMKDSGIDTSKIPTTEQQWKTSLESTKTRLKNQIFDLTKAIETRKEIATKRNTSAQDEETLILKSHRDSLKKIYDQIFEDPNLEAVKKARLAQNAINRELIRLDNQIGNYLTRIAQKDISTQKRQPLPAKTEDIRLMRETKDVAKQAFEDMKKELRPKKSPDEIALQSYKTRTANRIAELEKKVETGDFTKKDRKQLTLDAEGTGLKFKLSKAQSAYYEAAAKYQRENRSTTEKVWDGIKEVGNLSRAIKTSMDLSAVLRQGGFVAFGHPLRALKAFPDMFKALRSEEGRFAVDQEILARPNYLLYEQSKLYLSEHGQILSRMEEAYMSRLSDKIPGVAASERAYTTFLNRLRADSFDAMYKNLAIDGTPAELNAISNYINVATGRGVIGSRTGVINALATMNSVFFAPRYVLSRFQTLAGQPFYRGTTRTRIMVAKEYGRFLTGLAVVYALGTAAGGTIETDPRSTDAGKLRFGKTRLDPMAGLSQTAVVTSRIGSAIVNRVREHTFRGNIKDPSGRIKDTDILTITGRFGRSKFNPVVGIAVDLATGKNYIGQKISWKYAGAQLVPLALSDIYSVMEDQGVPAGTAFSMLSIFGMGLQTYSPKNR